MKNIKKIFDRDTSVTDLYSELTVYFQPIFSSKDGKVFGYESLARHKTKDIDIGNLFNEAKINGTISILDMTCRRNAIKEASKQKLNGYLFINICPDTLLNSHHEIGITDKYLKEFNFPMEKIVFEITEHSFIENCDNFLKSVFYYKERGYKIAIDDFGAGFGGPKLLSLIEPDFIKIDRYFINSMTENYFAKSFVEFTVSVCRILNTMVIAEGVETINQLTESVNIGIDLLQGYYLGKPQKNIREYFLCYADK